MNYENLKIHNSLPVPIRIRKYEYNEHFTCDKEYECICKYCRHPGTHRAKKIEWDGYSYIWNYCSMCKTKVWYWHQVCSLYGRRSPYIVCFYCRIPYYDMGYKNGEIYNIAKNLH